MRFDAKLDEFGRVIFGLITFLNAVCDNICIKQLRSPIVHALLRSLFKLKALIKIGAQKGEFNGFGTKYLKY